MQKFILALVLTAGNCLIFWNIQDFSFVWTDKEQILDNQSINPPSREGIRDIWQGKTQGLYTPLTQSAQSGIARLSRSRAFQSTKEEFKAASNASSGLVPKAFHTASLLVHSLNTILIFLILCLIFKGRFASFFGAALFAFHPLQVEPVAWSSGFGFLLGGFFALIAMWQYLHYSQAQESQSRKSTNPARHFYIATGAFVLSMLAIPSMAIVPVMAFILERLLPRERGFMPARKPVWPFILWGLISIPFVLLALDSQSTHAITTESSFWTRPLIAADAVTFYMQKILVPMDIGPDYGRSPVTVLSNWWGYVAWIIPFTFSLYLLYTRSKSRLWIGGSFSLLLAGLLPFLGFFAFESQATSTVANRYIYLAMLGPAVGLAYLISIPRNIAIPFLSILTVCTFSFLSISEIDNWKNDENLWKHALSINEVSPIAHKILADKYREKKDWENAKIHYRKVLKSNKTSPEVHFYLADIERMLGNQANAIPLYEKVLVLDPEFAAAHNALGLSLLADKKYERALGHFVKSVEASPLDSSSLHNLGKTYVNLGKNTEAIETLRKSLKVRNTRSDSQKSETQALLGQALSETGQKEMGQIHLETALKLDPDHAVANRILADLYFAQDNFEDALTHYKKAVKIFNDDAKILYNLGVIMSKKQKYKKSQNFFTQALEITPDAPHTLTNLGIADFNLKKFKVATNHFERALEINPNLADAHYYLGDIARWKGKKEESLSLYYRTLKISKYHTKAHYRLGNHFMSNDRLRQAIRHYRSALKSSPENKRVISSLKRAERALDTGSM